MADPRGIKRAGFGLVVALALLPILAGGAAAQGISGLSVAKNTPPNSADSFENGVLAGAQKESIVGVQPGATSTTFTVRYAKIVGTDTGIFTSRTENFTGNYTITFSVTAPGSYSLAVNTSRVGALTLVNDGSASATATLSALTGSHTGGTLLVPGTLSLPAVATLSSNSAANTAFSQPNSATITGVSNGVPQAHTLTFAWTASCASGSGLTGGDECAVRMGLPAEYDGETAGDYPGVGGRTQANDGHFVTVTFTSPCGNGTLEPGENEECDEGVNNGSPSSCCNGDCSLDSAGTDCRAGVDLCDLTEECDGVNGACPADQFAPFGTICRAGSAGEECDADEVCDGLVTACPPDGVESVGTVCRPVDGDCDVEEVCDGVASTCPGDAVVPGGTTCRIAAGVCDVDEECDGVDADCPTDGFVASGTACRAPVDVCDAEEDCTGSSADCPVDEVEDAGVTCRAATVGDVCDIDETCDGVGTACPADEVADAGVVCRSATVGDVCDIEEECDGTNKTCPADAVEAAGVVCRAASVGDVCDIEEECDGTNKACPADTVEPAGTLCRGSAGVCDIQEDCDGTNKACPADVVEPATTVCRPDAGDCDIAEQCDGNATTCPADGFEGNGTPCTDDNLFCTGDETCQGGTCTSDGDPCGIGTCDEPSDMCLVVGCGAAPLGSCKTADKSILLYKNKTPDSRDKLVYKWIRGQSTSQANFADPINSAQYDLCVYADGNLVFEANVPSDTSDWKTLSSKGYKYKDSGLTQDGTQKIILKGHPANKAKILWKGKGTNLPDLTALPIAMGDFPVLVQVVNSDNGMCFETSFDAADVKKNQTDQLRLKDQ